jgi:hypothetical protein
MVWCEASTCMHHDEDFTLSRRKAGTSNPVTLCFEIAQKLHMMKHPSFQTSDVEFTQWRYIVVSV